MTNCLHIVPFKELRFKTWSSVPFRSSTTLTRTSRLTRWTRSWPRAASPRSGSCSSETSCPRGKNSGKTFGRSRPKFSGGKTWAWGNVKIGTSSWQAWRTPGWRSWTPASTGSIWWCLRSTHSCSTSTWTERPKNFRKLSRTRFRMLTDKKPISQSLALPVMLKAVRNNGQICCQI